MTTQREQMAGIARELSAALSDTPGLQNNVLRLYAWACGRDGFADGLLAALEAQRSSEAER